MAFLAMLGLQKKADNKIPGYYSYWFPLGLEIPPPPPLFIFFNFCNLPLINPKQSKYRAFSWSLMTQGIESLTLTDH